MKDVCWALGPRGCLGTAFIIDKIIGGRELCFFAYQIMFFSWPTLKEKLPRVSGLGGSVDSINDMDRQFRRSEGTSRKGGEWNPPCKRKLSWIGTHSARFWVDLSQYL